jgi:hypothetical protein
LDDDAAAGFIDAFEFGGEIDILLPTCDGFGCFFPDPSHVQELLAGSVQNGLSVAKVFKQLAHPYRPDVVDQV